jgi:hypothetical protein
LVVSSRLNGDSKVLLAAAALWTTCDVLMPRAVVATLVLRGTARRSAREVVRLAIVML